MVKFNRRDKKLKDFDNILDEIMQCQQRCIDEEDISVEDVQYELYSESCTSSAEVESSSDTTELDLSCGNTFNISGGRTNYIELSEDFPHENSECEVQITKEQLAKLNMVDRSEYKDKKNILNPQRKKKGTQKRCGNFDD